MGVVFMAAPVAADDDEWSAYDLPVAGEDGDWFMDDTIDAGPGPIARDIDGYFWAYVSVGATEDIMKSLDTEGRGWAATEAATDIGAAIIDIVCSPLDADVVYVATAVTVYKTEDGGDSWSEVGDAALIDTITCLAVGWDDDDDPRVFIGDDDGDVEYLYDTPWGDNWTDLTLEVGGIAATGVLGIAVSPDFANDTFQAVLAVDADETFLAYHVGANPGSWADVELATDTLASDGSDPVFPADFNGDDFYDELTEIFVGTTGPAALEGVFRVYGVDALDVEKLDDVVDDIADLAAVGNMGNMQFLAGADGASDVWYSWDDGDTWEQASIEGINPAGGAVDTYVVIDADFDEDAGIGWAATAPDEGGVHMTIDGGTSWQGISLLDTDIANLLAAEVIVSSPEAVYIVTDDGAASDLFRYDSADETWTRLYQEDQYGLGDMDLIGVYGDTIVLAESTGDDMVFSSDGGQMFAEPDEEPTGINSLLVLDDETWWVGDDDGELWVTDDAGDRTWDEYEIEGTDAITSLAVRGDEAIAGTADAEIYYSEDAGETWDIVGALIDAGIEDTYVCFDSGNDNSDVIYATSDDTLARFQYLTTDLEEDWENYTIAADTLDAASGIACLEGVLYAGSGGDADGVVRVVEPLYDLDDADLSDVDAVAAGLAAGDAFDGGILITSPNVVWGIDIGDETLFTYTDLMVGPATGVVADPDVDSAVLTWDGFDNATNYEVVVYGDEDMTLAYMWHDAATGDDNPILMVNANSTTGTHEGDVLDAGTMYWVQVRASAPVHSKWSGVMTFTTNPGAIGIDEDTLAPALGATGVPTTTPFSWGFNAAADSYFIEISDTADFSNIIDSATVTVPAYQSAITLSEGTSYWFRVQAITGGQAGDPAYSSFTTLTTPPPAPAPPEPAAPVEIVQETITPNFIYAIIGIGAALAILVIVLILKTRRV